MANTRKLKNDLKELEEIVKGMKPEHYLIKSEYHRLMYGYTLKIEMIKMFLIQ